MTTAQQRGWGDPDSKGFRTQHIVKVTAGGISINVHRQVAPLFKGFLGGLVKRGYRLDGRADDWGYANRDVRGHPGVKSNHSWGLAVDLNSAANPMTNDGRVHTDMPSWVPKLAAYYGLTWGGYYHGTRKDPMHFEFVGTPQDARNLISKLYHQATRSNTRSQDVKTQTVKRGSKGPVVGNVQALLIAHGYSTKIDDDLGPNTEALIKDFQRKKGLANTGVVDDKTWSVLVNS